MRRFLLLALLAGAALPSALGRHTHHRRGLTAAAKEDIPDLTTAGLDEGLQLFPYMAYVQVADGADSNPCGGALVAPGYVLTAAQCVKGAAPGDVLVWVGGEWLDVETVLLPDQTNADVAMLVLATLSEATYAVLPTFSAPEAGDRVWATSWNSTEPNDTVAYSTLDVLTTCPSVPDADFCAGGIMLESCPDNKGSPVVLPTANKGDVLVGITSGEGCTDGDYGYYVQLADKGTLPQVMVWLNHKGSDWITPEIELWLQAANAYVWGR